MKKRIIRLSLILGLTLLAFAVPYLAWYRVGSRQVEDKQAQLTEEIRRQAQAVAEQLAQRLGRRLEDLLKTENRRPFYHYQSLFYDPKGAAESVAVVPSPLIEGAGDPWISAHFQIDAAGQLTLPTLDRAVRHLMNPQRLQTQEVMKLKLESARLNLREALPAELNPEEPRDILPWEINQVHVFNRKVWTQIAQAGEIYADIKSRKETKRLRPDERLPDPGAGPKDVVINVERFTWRTTLLGGRPTLTALRRVATPAGIIIQGFIVDSAAVNKWLHEAGVSAFFLEGTSAADEGAAAPLPGVTWRVSVETAAAMASAQAQAVELKRNFQRTFALGVIAAFLAGIWLVFFVWQAERLAWQRSQFAAAAAHELRTPLAGLRLYAEMLAEGLGDPSRIKRYARIVASESERLGRVVANVLCFSRMERNLFKVNPQPGNLGKAVGDCLAKQRPLMEAAGVAVELHISAQLPVVCFDREAVIQIVQNLLDNAEKHTRASADRRLRVAVEPQPAAVTVVVADRGPGIPPAIRRRLFRPFTRGANVEAQTGLGLGLALSYSLARAQGATLRYHDNPGGGAIFILSFPVAS